MSVEQFLAESRRIMEADLTTGPWMVETTPETGESRVLRRFEFFGDQLEVIAPGGLVQDDAEFIAHARTAFPKVLAALEAVVAKCREDIGRGVEPTPESDYVEGLDEGAIIRSESILRIIESALMKEGEAR